MENIKEVFKEKNFDDLTLYYINNFIEEFSELFGKFVSKEELVKRIKENLNHSFEFKELTEERGIHNGKEKKIILANSIKDKEEKIKEVVFHEMIHCITSREGYTCFSKSYHVDDEEQINIMTAHGLTEGFTQYLTEMRNARFNHKVVTSYPILAEQTKNLAELIGEETLINLGLNNPDGLYDVMQEHRLIEDIVDYNAFLDAFDIIWKNEKDIYLYRSENKNAVILLMKSIFGRPKELTNLDMAKKNLVEIFLNQLQYVEVNSVEDLKVIYEKITRYSKQIDAENNSMTYNMLWERINELIQNGMSKEEIIEGLDGELKEIVQERLYIDSFLELPSKEKLKLLADSEELDNIVLENRFEVNYLHEIITSLFGHEIKDKKDFYFTLTAGLAREILENNYDINKLSIEIIEFDNIEGLTFNLYENSSEGLKYLSTYSRDNVTGEVSRFFVVTSQEEIDSILERYSDIPKNAVIMRDSLGCILFYSGENDYVLVNDMEDVKENFGEITYISSKLEREYEHLKARMATYQRLNSLGAPKQVMEGQIKILNDSYRNILGIESGETRSIEEIEALVQNVKVSDIEEMLNRFINAARDRKKALEDDIGYR